MQKWWPDLMDSAYREQYVAPERCQGLPDFLRYVEPCIDLLQTPAHLDGAMKGLIRDMRDDGVVYAEVRFAPLLHTRRGMCAEEVAEVCCAAFREGCAATGLRGGLIFCTLRHFEESASMETVRLAIAHRDRGVVGFDLAGDEGHYGLEAHHRAFMQARDVGLPFTVHAGEARRADHLWEVIRIWHPGRIGHGVRCAEDPVLMTHIQEAGIHLEVCPGSNIQVGLYAALKEHPVDRLYREGLSIGINTDGRGLTATSLTGEYARLQETFDWEIGDFYRINLMAMEAAFCDDAVKAWVKAKLSEELPV
jgi:adenosine deaminase